LRMLRIRVLSDLHFEFHADQGKEFVKNLNPQGVDVLILAGDITKMRLGFDKTLGMFRRQFPGVPIVYVHGNHEFHESDRKTVVRGTKDAVSKLQGVHWLDCGIVEINGRRILGTPLWYSKHPAPKHTLLLSTDEEWARGLIRKVTEKGVELDKFTDFKAISGFPDWVYLENARAIKFLTDNVREGDIVVTHMLPTQKSVPDQFRGAINNGWFVCDVEHLIVERKPALWLHGHTHTPQDYMLGQTRIVCNPLGYPQEMNSAFDDNLTVEV